MLSNEAKENMTVGIIMASHARTDTKTELIDYVRSHNDAAIQASYKLGQMDMRMSAVETLRAVADHMEKGDAK